MLGGRRSGQNQALEQTRDSVLRYGERLGCELLNFAVLPLGMHHADDTRNAVAVGRVARVNYLFWHP
jgi:hypothetical protein